MEIRAYKEYKEEEILRLYTAVGWTAYTENMPVLREGFKNSMLVLAAYEGEELLGVIRTVGDEATIVKVEGYIYEQKYSRDTYSCKLYKELFECNATHPLRFKALFEVADN